MSELARLVVRLAVESGAFVRGMNDASKSSGDFVEDFKKTATELKSQVQLAQNTVREFAAAAEEAFEFAEEGAQIRQLGESFGRTRVSLDELRAASRGTVDDVSLMSQTMTLLAGTSGEVEQELTSALPSLLEIAKASNKLNPELGETSFLFESLATGVKRGSRLMIDNTGIVFGEAEAYEAYAEKVGVASDALTEEQKKIALLHMTLERGQRLIEQSGSSTESYADAYKRLRVEIKNTSDELKQMASVLAGPTVSRLAEVAAAFNNTNKRARALPLHIQAITSALGIGSPIVREYRQNQELANRAIEAGQSASTDYADAMMGVQQNSSSAASSIEEAGTAAAEARMDFLNAASALSEMSEKMMVQTRMEALKEAGLDAQALADAQEALLRQFGLLTDAEVSASGALEALDEMYQDGQLSAGAYASAIAAIKRNIDALESKEIDIGVNFRVEPLRLPNGDTVTSPSGDYAYAEGGFLPSGGFGIAGEAGPEMLRATSQGVQITPLNKAPSMASAPISFNGGSNGPGTNTTMNFYIDGARDPRAVAKEIERIWIQQGIMPRQRFM